MRSFSWGRNQQGTGWLNEYLSQHPLSQRVHRLWRWAFVSLGCAAGCTTPQHPGHVVGPIQATGEMLAQAGNSMTEVVTGRPRPNRMFSPTNGNMPLASKLPMTPHAMVGGAIPAAPPTTELAGSLPPGSYVIPSGNAGVMPPAAVVTIPTTKSVPTAAIPPTPTYTISQSVSPQNLPKPAALPPVPSLHTESYGLKPVMVSTPTSPPEPLPVKAASSSRPINPLTASLSSPVGPLTETVGHESAPVNQEIAAANSATTSTPPNWCVVRVRNISNKPIKKFSATVLPPGDGQMVVKETKTNQNMNVAQCDLNSDHPVNPGEELSVTVGLITANDKARHLHVQVRDALGGNQQAIQSRWQVLIEPAATP